jgi:hypothetical protein
LQAIALARDASSAPFTECGCFGLWPADVDFVDVPRDNQPQQAGASRKIAPFHTHSIRQILPVKPLLSLNISIT